MKRFLILVVALISLLTLGGCSGNSVDKKEKTKGNELSLEVKGDKYPLKIVDCLGVETILEEKSSKVAVLSGTPLNIWYDLGGKSICTSNVSENLKLNPEYEQEIKNLPEIGPVYSVDMEAIVEHNPDLIIAQKGTQEDTAQKLREMGFKVIVTHIKSYKHVLETYEAFGKILGEEKLAGEKIAGLEAGKEAIMSQLPKEGKSAAILYVTSRSLSVKLNNSIAGDVAKFLNINNIGENLPPETIGSESAPLDIEYLVEQNPEYILVTSMISNNDAAKETMEEEFKSNPAWKGVKAIEEGRVVYLPQEYFLYNAGPYYCEALEYMARGVYPEIYGEIGEWYGK